MILYVVIVVLIILFPLYIYLIESRKGGLEISTAQCAYNRAQYGATLNWDEHCLYINGHPLLIISCDFFYWRIPDQSRWESILKKYKSNGFNCVRICFHWGFHSPDEGKYYFERNRDIEYLLRLCEKIKLFVLAAPGPYICSETQAGGYPLWLLDKNLRVRHMDFTGYKKYDERFAAYEKEWFEVLLPIIAKHQITTKPDGCVIGMQIENKLIESKCGVPFGLHDEMRFLCKVARDCGINVPLFNNDSTELGSFIARTDEEENFFARTFGKLFGNRKKFGLDLYGFSKYVVLVPPAGKEQSSLMWKPWKPQMFMNGVDGIERKVRGFGGEAARCPIFIPELQGGWSNHYKTGYTFDDMFGYFGDFYTKLLFESVLAQGCTMTSIHTAYGGTNWGTIGDTDAYTSNDYSACIREYGYISSRMRDLRQSILFAKSFSDIFIKTERVRHPTVSSSIDRVVNLQRHSITTENHGEQVTLTFLRNFSKEKQAVFQINVDYQASSKMLYKIQLQCFLPYKLSFIALGNYTTLNGLKLVFSTLPIYLRTKLPASEVTPAHEIWIVPVNNTGELAFEGDVIVESNMSPSTRNCDRVVNAVSFDGSPGYAKIRKLGDDVDNCLYVLALDRSALGTLHGFFEEPYWGQAQRKTQQEDVIATKQGTQVTNEEQRQRQEQEQSQSSVSVHSPVYVAWGTQQAYYNSQSKTLEVYYGEEETELTLISLKPPSNSSTPNASYPLPFIHTIPLTPHHVTSTLDLTPQLRSWQKRVSDLANLNWRPTSLKQSPLEHGLTSGHILYKTCFPAEYKVLKSKVRLLINVRHRCSIFLNDHFVGGHTVYSKRLCVPGCKNGPELLTSFGKKKYDLTQFLKLPKSEEANVLIIVVENLGINRQMDMFNDARNPRGLISASFTGLKSGNKPQWSICGVDARRLDCSFITSGIPDEHKRTGWISLPSLPESGINPSDGLSWWKFSFLHPVSSKLRSELSAPLRLVLYGSFTSYIFLNGTLIGRYYGNGDSPQHDFYLMDGLLKHDEDNTIALLVYSWEPVIAPDLKVQVRGWEIDDANKSGNVARLRRGTEDVESASNGWVVWKASINL